MIEVFAQQDGSLFVVESPEGVIARLVGAEKVETDQETAQRVKDEGWENFKLEDGKIVPKD